MLCRMSSVKLSNEQADWEHQRQLAGLDRVLGRLHAWADEHPPWPPFEQAAALLKRFEPQLSDIRVRLDSVLVVGFVGGSGTGKSTLVNALVGQPLCDAGNVQRPTTTRPEIVCSPGAKIDSLGLDSIQPVVHRVDIPLLENMVLVDCPDPDTQPTDDHATDNRNRDILRSVLPHCDVIINVGSQQKYKTELVAAELLRHAPGRQIVFVQSRASRDDDVSDDWRRFLESQGFESVAIYRVDALAALDAAQQGRLTPIEFQQLTGLLRDHLANRSRHRIKRANALHLLAWLTENMKACYTDAEPPLARLEAEIKTQQAELQETVRTSLERFLQSNRNLWRTRLIDKLLDKWGGGLFTGFLRLIAGLGGWLRWAAVARARNVTQLAVTGGVSALASLREKWRENQVARSVGGKTALGIADSDISRARSILEGYADDADLVLFDAPRVGDERQRFNDAMMVELSAQVQVRVEEAVDDTTAQRLQKRASWFCHWWYELLFALLPGFVIYQLGRNFFYDHPVSGDRLMGLDYVVHAVIWIGVVGMVLRGMLLWWLSVGVRKAVVSVAEQVVTGSLLTPLSSDISTAVDRIRHQMLTLTTLAEDVERLEHEFGEVTDVEGLSKLGRIVVDRSAIKRHS